MTDRMYLTRAALPFIYDEGLYSVRTKSLPYSGNPLQGVWVLYDNRPADEEHQLLVKILMSVGLEPGETAMADLANFPPESTFDSLLQLKPVHILAFTGGRILDREFQLYRIENCEHAKVLCSHSLAELGANTELKKKFWHSLKELFKIT